MMMVEILDGIVYKIHPEYPNRDAIRGLFASNIHMEEAPDEVREGWIFDATKAGDARYSMPPIPKGWTYDPVSGLPIPPVTKMQREMERKALHAKTTNDTMEALRKIREGDTSRDWSKWLDMLDAYNLAIEKTKEQEGYPQDVTYPEYPRKPTS